MNFDFEVRFQKQKDNGAADVSHGKLELLLKIFY